MYQQVHIRQKLVEIRVSFVDVYHVYEKQQKWSYANNIHLEVATWSFTYIFVFGYPKLATSHDNQVIFLVFSTSKIYILHCIYMYIVHIKI